MNQSGVFRKMQEWLKKAAPANPYPTDMYQLQ